jgi:hypothetical protein
MNWMVSTVAVTVNEKATRAGFCDQRTKRAHWESDEDIDESLESRNNRLCVDEFFKKGEGLWNCSKSLMMWSHMWV